MSTPSEVWSKWHTAWHHDLSASERLSLLESIVSSNFVYTNMDITVPGGDLKQLSSVMENQSRQIDPSRLTSRHVQWLEQKHQTASAVQWEVVDRETGAVALKGWSYASYAFSEGVEKGTLRLTSVADFWG